MPDQGYLDKRKEEQDRVFKTSFWKDFVRELQEERKDAVDRCVSNSKIDSIREHQGKVKAIDKILKIPNKLWNEKSE